MNNTPQIFDHALLDRRRLRALKQVAAEADFLWQTLASSLIDRLDDVKRSFPMALNLGAHHGKLRDQLKGRYGIQTLLQLDSAPGNRFADICAREEMLPIKPASMDLIVSLASLHWVNDVPGCLMQLRHALKPDGLFLALVPGGQTLCELRESLDKAMLSVHGGISPRVSPMLGVQDAADLMQRAGFTLPVVDVDRIEISYSHPLKLLQDLRAMGQSNALIQRSDTPLSRTLLEVMTEYYVTHFAHPEGGVCATFDMIALTGWAPHDSQAKPLARGSGVISMKNVL